MSGAIGQVVWVGIREGSNNEITIDSNAGVVSMRALSVFTLAPSPDNVVKILQSQRIQKKGPKYEAYKVIH